MGTNDHDRTFMSRLQWGSSLVVSCMTLLFVCGCPGTTEPPPDGDTIDGDMTVEEFNVPAGETMMVENDAVVTVNGDANIDGTIEGMDSRVTLRVNGKLTINGAIMSQHADTNGVEGDKPFDEHDVGIHIIVGDDEVTIGDTAKFHTTGSLIITDDETVLDSTPDEFYDQVEEVAEDDPPTFAPLPPDAAIFGDMDTNGDANTNGQPKVVGPAMLPVTISGEWPDPDDPPPAGDRPVWIFRFNGNRPLNLDGWTVNGPPAPDGADADPDNNRQPKRGKNGMRINIWNNGGPINVANVVFNLTDGGDGGDDMDTCASATGKPGGNSGNFRMTASGGINMTGPLTINPGIAGSGGSATVTKGAAGATGCDGDMGASSTATGAKGADNKKRLLARGNVTGLANVTIGPLIAGDGGSATAEACDGGDGFACCSGGGGGTATSKAGDGGEASLNVSGLPVTVGAVIGGNGGIADATGGNGGNGGDCKFGDAGDGGPGGEGTATGGKGGSATGGDSQGGDAGDGIGSGGNGGTGGDSGLGNPGAGGAMGTGVGDVMPAGSGDVDGSDGDPDSNDGMMGADGGDLAIFVFCIPVGNFIMLPEPGPIEPGVQMGPIFNEDESEEVGSVEYELVTEEGRESNFQFGVNPEHIGIGDGILRIDLAQLAIDGGTPGIVGGLRIVPLQGFGIDQTNPLTVRAYDAKGGLIGEQSFAEIPFNFGNIENAQSLEAAFETVQDDPTQEAVPASFEIEAPFDTFVTIYRIYLIDP
ncbi:MAG: hypothetical protein R3E58_08515 [Phycisphaerae bacterium]|nr:hypothetical protein [Phycisphaerales bacterium]